VVFGRAVREVDTRHVHASHDQIADALGARGADGADQLCSRPIHRFDCISGSRDAAERHLRYSRNPYHAESVAPCEPCAQSEGIARQWEEKPVAELDTEARDKLRKDQFAYVDSKGGEHLPINDDEHIRNAMARFNQTEFESTTAKERARRKIVSAAKKHGIEIADDSNVAKPVRSGRKTR